jgi:hypothetical protein
MKSTGKYRIPKQIVLLIMVLAVCVGPVMAQTANNMAGNISYPSSSSASTEGFKKAKVRENKAIRKYHSQGATRKTNHKMAKKERAAIRVEDEVTRKQGSDKGIGPVMLLLVVGISLGMKRINW